MADAPQISAQISANSSDFVAALQEATRAAQWSAGQLEVAFQNMGGQIVDAMKESDKETKAHAEGMKAALEGVKETVMHLLEAYGLIKAFEWTKEAIFGAMKFGEELNNLSIQTGITVENLQKLQYSATVVGISIDRLVMIVSRLTREKTQLETGHGGGLQQMLAAFKMAPSDLNDTYGALEKIGDALNRLGPSSNQARAALVAGFGARIGPMLAPALANLREMGDELEKMGLVLNKDLVTALDHGQEAWNRLGVVWEHTKAIVTVSLAPALEVIAKALAALSVTLANMARSGQLTSVIENAEAAIANGAITILWGLGTIFDELADLERKTGKVIALARMLGNPTPTTMAALWNAGSGSGEGLDTAAKTARNLAEELRKVAQAAVDATGKIGAALKQKGQPGDKITGDSTLPDPRGDFKKFTESLDIAKIMSGKDAWTQYGFAITEYTEAMKRLGASAPETGTALKKVAEGLVAIRQENERNALAELASAAKIQEAHLATAQSESKGAFALRKAALEAAIKDQVTTTDAGQQAIAAITKEETALEISQANKRFEVQKSELDSEIAYLQQQHLPEYLAKIKQLQAEIEVMTAKHQTEVNKLTSDGAVKQIGIMADIAKQTHTIYDSVFGYINTGFDKMIDGMFSRTTSFAQTMKTMLADIGKDILKSGIKEALLGGGKDALFSQGGLAGMLGGKGGGFLSGSLFGGDQKVDTATINAAVVNVNGATAGGAGSPVAAAAGTPATSGGGLAGSLSAALGPLETGIGLVAGNTLKNVLMLPIHLAQLILHTVSLAGILTAAVVPKVTVTTVDAPFGVGFMEAVTAAGGADLSALPRRASYAARLHPEEMVLPKKYANVIRQMAEGGGSKGADQQPDIHFHASFIDETGVRSFFERNKNHVANALRDSARNFRGM